MGEMLKKSTLNWNVAQYNRMNKKGDLNFEIAIQRHSDVWDIERKSLLISSYLEGYPVPAFYAYRRDGIYYFMDGKQRLTSTFQFLNDEFALFNIPILEIEEDIMQEIKDEQMKKVLKEGEELKTYAEHEPNENGLVPIDLNGLKFSDLPLVLQNVINNQSLTTYKFDDITDEQRDEMYRRLNNGVPFTAFELTRIQLGEDNMDKLTEIFSTELFQDKVKLSDKQYKRYVDQEIVLQVLKTLYGNDLDLSMKEIRSFGETLDITDEMKQEMISLCEYINVAMEKAGEKQHKKFLKKSHIPIIFHVAQQAIKKGMKAESFSDRIVKFFSEKKSGSIYNTASRSGSARKKNVEIRITEMSKAIA